MTKEPTSEAAPLLAGSDQPFNWIVPLRRVVIKDTVRYRDLMWRWLELLAPHRVHRPDLPRGGPPEDESLGDAEYIIALWYDRDPLAARDEYRRAVARLRRWWHLTFLEAKIASSPVGTTTCEIGGPNFHARLWKGPKRVILEQNAEGDEALLDNLQPFDLLEGRIQTRCDKDGTLPKVVLYPGDVLELPLHVFLSEYGLHQFAELEFDPEGSFYLGTSVRSSTGKQRNQLPRLPDNMLAMRYQLVHALNMANCYHDEPVYTDEMKVLGKRHSPQGAGLYARGMPFCGNPTASVKSKQGSLLWEVGLLNTNIPEDTRPINMPTWGDIGRYSPGLPLTWGWVCSPFALFFFNFLADAHESNTGVPLPGSFRSESLAKSVLLSGSAKKNSQQLEQVQEATATDPLVLHGLTKKDVVLPRAQTPLGDLCHFLIPENFKVGDFDPFNAPENHRVRRLRLPEYGSDATHDWNELCPGAGLVCVSSAEGHEFMLVKLYPSGYGYEQNKQSLAEGATSLELPFTGRMSAYNPLSGEDVCDSPEIVQTGHYFVSESGARMPPGRHRSKCATLKLSEVRVHKFGPSPANKAVLGMKAAKKQTGNKKQKNKIPDQLELQIDDEGRGFRSKRVSSVIWIPEGEEGSKDPRTLANIYARPRESWTRVTLKAPSGLTPKPLKKFLRDAALLYGERAVPFPTIMEVVDGFSSRERAEEQLAKHRDWIRRLGQPEAEAFLDAEIAKASGREKKRLEKDKKLLGDTEAIAAFLAELPP